MSRSFYLPLAGAVVLAGCASIDSTPTDKPDDGLVYYMPKKDVMVTVVRDAAKTTVTVLATSAYADLEQPYVLNFKRNWIGKNEIAVGISSTGLLTSAKSTTTSGISDALKNLASSISYAKGLSAPPTTAPDCTVGTFTHSYTIGAEIPAKSQPCGLTVKITRVAKSKFSGDVKEAQTPPKPKNQKNSGIFYRQEETYRVDVVGDEGQHAVNTSAYLLSPSQSPVRFLPIEKTLFASNQADFGFIDGIPTKYDQNADGELIGLLKLPADVIGAYFAAVGNVFDSLKSNSSKEVEALTANVKLELAKMKYAACIEALQTKDDTLIQQLDCGK